MNQEIIRQFWDDKYLNLNTGWDLGEVSPPLKTYIDQLTDKNFRVLIPGCGNTYEADYLLQQGFSDITVIDIAPSLVEKLKEKYRNNNRIKVVLADFFEFQGEYDLILEQTFFCAINPELRTKYKNMMLSLLSPTGKLVGLLFNKYFEKDGPPHGGTKESYEILFKNDFDFLVFEDCHNSFFKRQNTELFIILKKKSFV